MKRSLRCLNFHTTCRSQHQIPPSQVLSLRNGNAVPLEKRREQLTRVLISERPCNVQTAHAPSRPCSGGELNSVISEATCSTVRNETEKLCLNACMQANCATDVIYRSLAASYLYNLVPPSLYTTCFNHQKFCIWQTEHLWVSYNFQSKLLLFP